MRKLLFVLPLIGALASGCASAQAKGGSAERPALIVPPPPARIIEPAEVAPEPVGELPPLSSGASRTAPTRPAAPRPAANDARPEARAGETAPKPQEAPQPEPTAPAPSAQLRTPQTADTSAAAKSVRTTIDTARGTLNGVNFGLLSNVRKKAYNDAKLLIQQAEDALKEGNLAFAQGLATKAETLAKELAGR
jgi:hypothetical protein